MSRLAARASEVTVSFKDTAFIFALPSGATLEEIAARIAEVGRRRPGAPVAINVRLAN